MIPYLCGMLRDKGALPGVVPGTPLSTIKVHTTAIGGGSLVSLVFAGDEPEPRFVVRVPREPSRTERVLRNYRTLQALQKTPSLYASVPAPVFCGNVEGVPITVETFLPGSPAEMGLLAAHRSGDPRPLIDLIARGAEWLRNLHQVTAASADEPRILAVEWADDAVRAHLIDGEVAAAAVPAARSIAPDLRLWSRRHGDFAPNNLLLKDGTPGLAVVDWEYSGDGYVLFDLLDLVVQGHVQHNSDAVRPCLEKLISGGTPIADAVRAATVRCTGARTPDEQAMRAIMVAYALDWLSRDARRAHRGVVRPSDIALAMLAAGLNRPEPADAAR